MAEYNHSKIERKWQNEWEKNKLYKIPDKVDGKENYFTLVEFTYPSGNLHVGHWYAFSVPDIFARYKRMQGFNSLYPMGFDAFGLPAENAAIKEGADPKKWTFEKMDTMRGQLRSMGAMFDWDREVVSCAPEYYKWTQWMFNKFLEHDLVYRAATKVNWCPKDQTILANEQVIDGKCDRCGTEVEQRDQEQWMLRITKYADRLIDDLDKLDWPEEIKAAQKNWIGRSEGSEIFFPLVFKTRPELNNNRDSEGNPARIPVFTTRADTLFGATYMVLSPEHLWVTLALDKDHEGVIDNADEVRAYVQAAKKKSELDRQQSKEKTGVEIKGVKAINPATGEEIPIWIADYVLAGYGTGAIMAVPAHDERDFEFAKKFDLPVRQVVGQSFGDKKENEAYVKGVCAFIYDPKADKFAILEWNHGLYGLVAGGIEKGESLEATIKREMLEESGLHEIKTLENIYFANAHYWNIAKNVYRDADTDCFLAVLDSADTEPTKNEAHEKFKLIWTSPEEILKNWNTKNEGRGLDHWIELLHKALLRLKEMNYPVKLLRDKEVLFTGYGKLIHSGDFDGLEAGEAKKKITEFVGGKMVKTYRLRDWGISRQRYWGCPIAIVYDPEGNAHPVPDEHLPWILPTDVDHTPSGVAPLAKSKELFARTEKIFGKGWKPEVETMDTFVDSSWYFYRYLDSKNETVFADKEKIDAWMPVDLYMGGAEHTTMHLLYSRFWVKALHDLGLVDEEEAYVIRRNRGLILGPDGNKMSKSKGNVINPDEIVERLGADTVRMYLAFMGPYGVTVNYPWDPNGVVGVRRFLERVWKLQEKIGQGNTTPFLHKVIKKMTEDISEYKFNTAIAQMMMLVNIWEKTDAISADEYKTLLKLLAPFAPHVTEELWHNLGETESIHLSTWPSYNEVLVKDEELTIAIQINGKVRAEITARTDASEDEIKEKALAEPTIAKYTEGKTPKRIIYVKNRLINIVI